MPKSENTTRDGLDLFPAPPRIDPGYTVVNLPPFFPHTFMCPGCEEEVDYDTDDWGALPYFCGELSWDYLAEQGWHSVCVECFREHDRRGERRAA